MRTFATAIPLEDDALESAHEAMRELFDALLARPVPAQLLALVDSLDGAPQPA